MIIPSLTSESCRLRQDRLRSLLRSRDLDAAVLTDRGYVHALTGYWHRQPLTAVAVLVDVEGPAVLIAPEGAPPAQSVDSHTRYTAQRKATLIEDVAGALLKSLCPLLQNKNRIGYCVAPLHSERKSLEWVNITAAYQRLRRLKDHDEAAILRFAIDVTQQTMEKARAMLPSRPTEIEIHAAMYGTALHLVGEPLSGWGNDFQSGSPGGLPRHRRPDLGEIAVYDVGIGVRGYRSDLCRSFVVGGEPSADQRRAHARVVEVLQTVEAKLKPGTRCLELYEQARDMLDGWQGFSFTHHLGHGIGLDAHETPRLNPAWEDVLAEGDVVAVEPALYGDSLRAGIRLEQDYLITADGFERLSSLSLEL